MKFTAIQLMMLVAIIPMIMAAGVRLDHLLTKSRATECSSMLHRYSKGTLIPLTQDASIEIGACLLEFNQPLAEGDTE